MTNFSPGAGTVEASTLIFERAVGWIFTGVGVGWVFAGVGVGWVFAGVGETFGFDSVWVFIFRWHFYLIYINFLHPMEKKLYLITQFMN